MTPSSIYFSLAFHNHPSILFSVINVTLLNNVQVKAHKKVKILYIKSSFEYNILGLVFLET
jgi:hypothetical protein